MNRTLKEATVKRYHHDSFEQLQEHLAIYLQAYNSAKRLKSLRFKIPREFLAQKFFNNPIPFEYNPTPLLCGAEHLPFVNFSSSGHTPGLKIGPTPCLGFSVRHLLDAFDIALPVL
jgi:hypothetical protein